MMFAMLDPNKGPHTHSDNGFETQRNDEQKGEQRGTQ